MDEPTIPKHVYQTAQSLDAVPSDCRPLREAVQCFCASHGFEYSFFNDGDREEFIKEEYPEYFPLFDSLERNIEKADFWRYLIILKYGGLYLDLDCELTSDFILVDRYRNGPIAQVELDRWVLRTAGHCQLPEIGVFFFGFPGNSPILGEVVAEVVHRLKTRPYSHLSQLQEVLFTTGPGPFGEVLIRHRSRVQFFRPSRLVIHHGHGGWTRGHSWGKKFWLLRRCSLDYVC